MVNWACNFAVSVSFLSLVGALGAAGTFALYAAVASVGFVSLFLTMPETAGLPLESIQALFVKPEVPGRTIGCRRQTTYSLYALTHCSTLTS